MSELGHAEPLHLRLFIEGFEVPIISAVITANEGAPASGQLEIVPANAGLHLLARSKVTVFFFDGGADIRATRTNEHVEPEERVLEREGYYLLFSGEVFSITYSKSGAGARSLVLQCLDDSNNWDTSYLYTLRYSSDEQENVVAGSTAKFLAISGTGPVLDDTLGDLPTLISNISRRNQALSPSVAGSRGMLGGLLGVLELIGGVQGKYIGMSAWHTIQEARLRLMDQIAADDGATAVEVFNQTAFEEWLKAGVGDLGSVVSFRTIIDLINQYIYYSVSPNPVGVYFAGLQGIPKWPDGLFEAAEVESTDTEVASGEGESGLQPEFAVYKNKILSHLINVLGWNGTTPDKPKARMSSGYRSPDEQRKVTNGTTREGEVPQSPHMYGFAADFSTERGIGFCYLNKGAQTGKLHKRLVWAAEKYGAATPDALYTIALKKGLLSEADVADAKRMILFYNDLRNAVAAVGDGLIKWGGTYKGRDAWCAMHDIGGDCVHTELIGWRQKIPSTPATGLAPPAAPELAGFYTNLLGREKLHTQFFHPDIWFASPPQCNVIFPEEVTSLTFNRDFMRETTRLQLTTVNTIIGDDSLVNPTYFAPSVEGTLNLTSGGLGTAARAFIMPHEIYTGAVPKMEKMSDLSLYVRLAEEQAAAPATAPAAATPAAATPAAATPAAGTTATAAPAAEPASAAPTATPEEETETALEIWAARTTAFTFLSYRYAARTVSLSLKFTPRLALGFPALVIDRTNPETTDDDNLKPSTSPFTSNHFLGMLRSMTHSVTQDGGATSVTLTHARLHKATMDDLFAASVYKNKGILSIQTTPVDGKLVTATLTPGGAGITAKVIKWLELLETKLRALPGGFKSAGTSYTLLPDFPGPTDGTLISVTLLKDRFVGDATVAWKTSEGILPVVEIKTTFGGVSYTEKALSVSSGYLPLEEAIRPAWISETYSNALIGGFYKEILGCGSIHDMYPNADPGTAPNGTAYTSASVEQVTEALVAEYSAHSDGGYLGHTFIYGKTKRKYASIGEMFGYWTGKGKERKYVEGFLSQSIGWNDTFANLGKGSFIAEENDRWSWMKGEGEAVIGTQVNTTEPNKINVSLDPRQGRAAAAIAYMNELAQALGRRG
jgi:hypothetical protein